MDLKFSLRSSRREGASFATHQPMEPMMLGAPQSLVRQDQGGTRLPDGWDGDYLLNYKEALSVLGYTSRTTLNKLVKEGSIIAVKRGKSVRFLASSIKKYMSGGPK